MEELVITPEPKPENRAFSIFKNPKTFRWELIEIRFNAQERMASEVIVLRVAEERSEIIQAFKIETVKAGFMG